jgi:pimeloyl-ACP methyl ester carboxylesterase
MASGRPVRFALLAALAILPLMAQTNPVFYRTVQVDGLSIFYREAGPKEAPALLLLHGLPSSSRMFEPLLSRLSDYYHLIAPDYPGFGSSDAPDPKRFEYTFDRIASVMGHFTEALGLSKYALYMQDYGGPVGFRMALAHPDRATALIVQNAVAHNEGLGATWKTRRAFWKDKVAFKSRGYQVRGTMIVRPSARSTASVSSVTRTSRTRSPALGWEALILSALSACLRMAVPRGHSRIQYLV